MSTYDDQTPDTDPLASDLIGVDEVAERVRLAALALAIPFAEMRQGQLEREAARAAAHHGDDDPETESRLAAARAGAARFAQLRTETIRARATPFVPEADAAGISGVVTRRGEPEPNATVSVLTDGKGESARTGESGTFALAVPAGAPVRLTVHVGGTEVHRDSQPATLASGQTIVRQIELEGATAPHPSGPTDELVEVPTLVGLAHEDARSVLAKAGLEEGDVTRRRVAGTDVGRVVAQSPDAGTRFARLSAVDLTIGVARSKRKPKTEGESG